MAIVHRRGSMATFDPSKLVAGEFAYVLDVGELYYCYNPGNVKKIATFDDMVTNIDAALEQISEAYLEQINNATAAAEAATDTALDAAENADIKAAYAYEKGQEAQTIVDSAAPIINTNLQAAYADKGTITGQSVQFPTADNGLAEITNIQGKYSQAVTVQGKQLFDKAKVSSPKYIQPATGVETTSSFSNNASPKIYTGTETNVTISGHTYVQPNTPVGIAFYNSSNVRTGGTSYQNANGNGTYAIPAGTSYLRYTINNVDLNTSQIEFGTVATSYAAFVPNSPSPDYPSVIHNVGDVPFEVWAIGTKNLFDKDKAVITSLYNKAGVVANDSPGVKSVIFKCLPNTVYSVQKKAGARFRVSSTSAYPATGVTVNNHAANDSGSTINNFTSGNNDAYLLIYYFNADQDTATTEVDMRASIQIELGTTATPYEPYKGNQTPVSDMVLSAVPDGTKDESISDGITAKVITRTRLVTKSSGVVGFTDLGNGNVRFSIQLESYSTTGTVNVALSAVCDKLNPGVVNTTVANTFYVMQHPDWNGVRAGICIPKSYLTTYDVAGANAWLALNPITIRYAFVTPLKPAIETTHNRIFLTSYPGTTNVYTTDPLQPTFTAVAKSELWSKDYLINLGIKALQDGKINKTDITSQSTTNDANKVPSSQVTYAQGQEINLLKNDLARISFSYTVGTVATLSNVIAKKNKFSASFNGTLTFTQEVAVGVTVDIITLSSDVVPGLQQLFVEFVSTNLFGIIVSTAGIIRVRPFNTSFSVNQQVSINLEWII